jgi:DUF1680 family protein
MKPDKSQLVNGFWKSWQEVNADTAIFHQYEQLERSGCIDNFRILAEGKDVFRRGWYFADSDAYKWLDAAFSILQNKSDPKLWGLTAQFVDLVEKAQSKDGYLYTFNQIHFPGKRWENLQIEHELYCHGHLIEAFVSGSQVDGFQDKIEIACKTADRIVADFLERGPAYTPGHEEIEIALLRLYEVTNENDYLNMAQQFLEKRGRDIGFALKLVKQAVSNNKKINEVALLRANYLAAYPGQDQPVLPEGNQAEKPANIQMRWVINTLTGKFFQQHQPLKKQTAPVGHAVRFAYLQTAGAMLDRLTNKHDFTSTLQKIWQHMVARRMYITGGIGSLPVIEGFGKDYELDPLFAYAETCAGLGSLFWNREMARLTGDARYSDLYEWQLYNAVLVGMGIDGKTYFYNNPLVSKGNLHRQSWYEVPCCPSNLSRTFAGLQNEILTFRQNEGIDIQQYISSTHRVKIAEDEMVLEITSSLPWEGSVKVEILQSPSGSVSVNLRMPSWADKMDIRINRDKHQQVINNGPYLLHPESAKWVSIARQWETGDRISLKFDLPIRIYRPHPKIKALRRKCALTRGPLVYCLESVDNPGIDLFSVDLDTGQLNVEQASDLLEGIRKIRGQSKQGDPLTFIPYFLWGNRGASQMTVFFNDEKEDIP